MAVVTTNSPAITSANTIPPVAVNAGKGASFRVRSNDGHVAVASGDSIASQFRAVRIPSNAVVKNVMVENTALGALVTGDIGLYYPATSPDLAIGQTALAAINAGFFGTAVSLVAASAPVDVTNESGVYTLDKRNQPIWQAVGLTADPGGKFDVVITQLGAATAAAGFVRLVVTYVEM